MAVSCDEMFSNLCHIPDIPAHGLSNCPVYVVVTVAVE